MRIAARPMAVFGCGPLCVSAARRSGDGGWRDSCAGQGCAAHEPRRRIRTTVADPRATPAPDRVGRAFAPTVIGGPDRRWLADISYIPTREGWLYLAIILDGFSRRVVGWAMADHLQTALVLAALRLALQRRRPAAGLIHYSDRGCQYTALAFGQHLRAPAWSRPPARSGTATTTPSPSRSSPRSK